tara:strand:- start:2443 stop:2727 length:285 start_codon:yes stop_codon:yes gene_type:complete
MSKHNEFEGVEHAEPQYDEENYPVDIALEIVLQDMTNAVSRMGDLVEKFMQELREERSKDIDNGKKKTRRISGGSSPRKEEAWPQEEGSRRTGT